MAYEISADHERELLTVRYRGLVTVAERTASLAELLPLLDTHGIRHVLADLTDAKVAVDSFDESSAFASRLSSEALARGCRIAYVTAPGARANPVVDTLATARGFRFGRFTDRATALEWLLPAQVIHRAESQ